MQPLPRKLKRDAIAETIFEVRFESMESKQLPEVALGKLASEHNWQGFETVRLPLAEFPNAARAQYPDLRFQPVMELRCKPRHRIAKIGPNVFSYHVLAPYPGWEDLQPELEEKLDFVFKQLHDFRATRLGLRYINLLDSENHGIGDISELNLSVELAGRQLTASRLVQFETSAGDEHTLTVRLASPHFVQGPIKSFSALIDVDVFTKPDTAISEVSEAKTWLSKAHDHEKVQFFELLKPETVAALMEA